MKHRLQQFWRILKKRGRELYNWGRIDENIPLLSYQLKDLRDRLVKSCYLEGYKIKVLDDKCENILKHVYQGATIKLEGVDPLGDTYPLYLGLLSSEEKSWKRLYVYYRKMNEDPEQYMLEVLRGR